MPTTGFAHRHAFRTGIARWLLIIATGTAASACSSNPLSSGAALPGHGKLTIILPGQITAAERQKSADAVRAGDAAREKGDLDTAAKYYADAAGANPTSIDAQLRLGSVSLARKDESSAVAAYEAAQNFAPKNAEAAFRLGELDLTHGQAKAAVDQFAIALEARKDDPKLYNAMGVAQAMRGEYALAKQAYDQGLAIDRDYPALRNNYGLMQLATGDMPGALATFSALVALPQASPRYRLNRALVELAQGHTDAALADAPGMDESALRQTLAIYVAPAQGNAGVNSTRVGDPPPGDDTAKSSLPSVHLALDSATATAAATAPAIKPVAALPAAANP